MTSDERWAFAVHWVDENKSKLNNYIYKHYLLNYSAYAVEDFLSESYMVAYEALSCKAPFEACFWVLFKNRCKKTLANKQHTLKNRSDMDVQADYEERLCRYTPLGESAFDEITGLLDYLTPCQREVIRLIAGAGKPLAIIELAEILGISRQAVEQRINRGINTLKDLMKIFDLNP